MAKDHDIYMICGRCNGTGKVPIDGEPHDGGPPSETDCPRCEWEGELLWGRTEKV